MEKWIRFMAPVHPQSATALMRVIDSHISTGARHIHLMLSSPGGSVFHGLSIHNFLRGAPVDVTTYNFGSVDSIEVVLFCSGKQRICVPHARFLIHGVSFNVQANAVFDEKGLEEHLKLLKMDYNNIARVIADATGRQIEQIVDDMNNRTALDSEQAKNYGLVHTVQSELFKYGSELTVIHEDSQIERVLPGLMQAPLPMDPGVFTQNPVKGETAPSSATSGTYFGNSAATLSLATGTYFGN